MKLPCHKQFNFMMTLSLILTFMPSLSISSGLRINRTPSAGYQPQFQVSGNEIYYVWHEYDGPYRQIFTAEMNINGTGRKAEKRTSGQSRG